MDRVDLTIGVDVGGTKIAAGVVDPVGNVVDDVRIATPGQDADAVETGVVDVIHQLAARHTVSAVGLAVAGFVNAERTILRFAPNLPMRDRPLSRTIGRRVGLPVVVENDANAAAWAEHRFGAGRDVPDVVMLTLGTGLGAGIVVGGALLRGGFGAAAELGHLRMVPGGLICGCGNRGCWEQYSSGSALVRDARALAESDPVRGAALLACAGGRASAIEGRMVTEVARVGDPSARGLLAGLGRWLGEGIADLANVLDPQRVVIGGGLCEAGDLLLDPAREAYAAVLSAGKDRPHLQIVPAALGNGAGVVGAADLARS